MQTRRQMHAALAIIDGAQNTGVSMCIFMYLCSRRITQMYQRTNAVLAACVVAQVHQECKCVFSLNCSKRFWACSGERLCLSLLVRILAYGCDRGGEHGDACDFALMCRTIARKAAPCFLHAFARSHDLNFDFVLLRCMKL